MFSPAPDRGNAVDLVRVSLYPSMPVAKFLGFSIGKFEELTERWRLPDLSMWRASANQDWYPNDALIISQSSWEWRRYKSKTAFDMTRIEYAGMQLSSFSPRPFQVLSAAPLRSLQAI